MAFGNESVAAPAADDDEYRLASFFGCYHRTKRPIDGVLGRHYIMEPCCGVLPQQ